MKNILEVDPPVVGGSLAALVAAVGIQSWRDPNVNRNIWVSLEKHDCICNGRTSNGHKRTAICQNRRRRSSILQKKSAGLETA